MPSNNSPVRRAERVASAAIRRTSITEKLLKPCETCGKTHRVNWDGCARADA